MIEIRGLYNTALCYTSALEEKAAEQIRTVCDQEEFAGCRIRIMPDVHAGKGCTIGTTMTISDKVVPGMVGVDIGCGMETVRLAEREIDFAALDALIRREVPSGRNVRGGEHPFNAEIDLSELRCAHSVSLDWARRSIGTLGGGNHFIEIDRAENGALYLVVHSGSRYLGTQVCAYYQEQGQLALRRGAQERDNALIDEYRAAGRQREIRSALKELDGERVKRIPKDLAYVEGELFEDYIHDMHITQRFAALNRKAITDVILRGMGLTKVEEFTTVHNYIDTEKMILRKGAVSAEAGEKLLIPVRDCYRPDIDGNLKAQLHTELTGFAAKVHLLDIPKGQYRFGMLMEDGCSRQKLFSYSSWVLRAGEEQVYFDETNRAKG